MNFLKYSRCVFFPRTVIPAFTGFDLFLGQELGCLITGSRFVFCSSSSSFIFSVAGGKIFSFSVYDSVYYSCTFSHKCRESKFGMCKKS